MNPWKPEPDQVSLKVLGKTAEELGELTAIISRCIIQGINESDPVTKLSNRERLEEEVADVVAQVSILIDWFGLSERRVAMRSEDKMTKQKIWMKME